MSNDNKRMLKYNHGEKSIKVPSIRKWTNVKIILKNLQQMKTNFT